MNRKLAGTGLAVALLAAALAAWWLMRQEAESKPAGDAPWDQSTASAPPLPAVASARPAPSESDWSGWTLPVELETLRSRADSGDHVAGCQLGSRLLICSSAAQFADARVITVLKEWEEEAMRAGNPREANDYAEKLMHSITLARVCEGVPASPERMGYHYLRNAALAGNADATLLHAAGGGLGTSMKEGMAYMRDGRFDQWRSEAPGMLQARLESGDPGALVALINGYSGRGKLGWILPPDPDRALALSQLGELLFEPPDHAPYAGDLHTSPERARRAYLQAQAWHAEYFDGQKFPTAPHLARVSPPRISLETHQAPTVSCASGVTAP